MLRTSGILPGILFFLLSVNPARAEPASFFVPPELCSATMQVNELGFANVTGIFGRSTASFKFEAGDNTITRLRFAIETSSLITGNIAYATELTGTNQFASRQYPEITFIQLKPATFKDGKAKLEGELGIRDQRKPFTIEANLNRMGSNPNSGNQGYAIGLSLRGIFKRSDFGMTNPYEEKVSRFGEEISLMLEMQGIKQE